MKVFGYARISTEAQNLDRQIDMLNKHGIDKLFTEKMTGTKADRPELERMMDALRAGDVVVVESLSRLGRSTKNLLELFQRFEILGVKVISLKEAIDTKTASGRLLLTLMSSISEFERAVVIQRCKEGLNSARARGRIGGRPKVNRETIDKAIKLYESNQYSVSEIVKLTGISVSSLYKYLKVKRK